MRRTLVQASGWTQRIRWVGCGIVLALPLSLAVFATVAAPMHRLTVGDQFWKGFAFERQAAFKRGNPADPSAAKLFVTPRQLGPGWNYFQRPRRCCAAASTESNRVEYGARAIYDRAPGTSASSLILENIIWHSSQQSAHQALLERMQPSASGATTLKRTPLSVGQLGDETMAYHTASAGSGHDYVIFRTGRVVITLLLSLRGGATPSIADIRRIAHVAALAAGSPRAVAG